MQIGRIQDCCHYQVKWEWMSLSQIELVWVRVRIERGWFWVNLREENKVSESKMAGSKSNMAEFKMAAIIKLSQNEWVKVFLCKWSEPILASVSEFERKNYYGWIQDGGIQVGRIQDGCHHQVESEWMSEGFLCAHGGNQSWKVWVSLRGKTMMAESKLAEFKIAAIINLSENEWVWVRLN